MILDWNCDNPAPSGVLRDADGVMVFDCCRYDTETGKCVVLSRDDSGGYFYDPVTDSAARKTVYMKSPMSFVPFDKPRKNGMLTALFDLVCENLPEDWEICVEVRKGEADIKLFSPDGELVEMCDDDLTTDEIVLSRVNHARTWDGLCEVGDVCP